MKRLILFLAVALWPIAAAADYRDEIALDMALVTLQADVPSPSPTPDGQCERCGGTGWITHGDGHKTPCPECKGARPQGILGISDVTKAVKETCEKVNRILDGFWIGGLTIHIDPPRDKPTVTIPATEQYVPPVVKQQQASSGCESGQCERRTFFPRMRRRR